MIPEVDVTGFDNVDEELGLMLKWRDNGSTSMAASNAVHAAMELISLTIAGHTTPNQLQAFHDFVEEEFY